MDRGPSRHGSSVEFLRALRARRFTPARSGLHAARASAFAHAVAARHAFAPARRAAPWMALRRLRSIHLHSHRAERYVAFAPRLHLVITAPGAPGAASPGAGRGARSRTRLAAATRVRYEHPIARPALTPALAWIDGTPAERRIRARAVRTERFTTPPPPMAVPAPRPTTGAAEPAAVARARRRAGARYDANEDERAPHEAAASMRGEHAISLDTAGVRRPSRAAEAAPAMDVRRLTDEVLRTIDQRLVAQRERMGEALTMGLKRARITDTDSGEHFEVMFNPEEYTLTKEINFAQFAVPGLRSPLLQFAHGNLKTLEMELLVDTYEAHGTTGVVTSAGQDVRDITGKITKLLDINPKTHAPPVLLFTWGSLTFRCVLARVTERFIMFLPTGIPVRARLQVTFNEFTTAEFEGKEVKRETADYSKWYILGDDESLSAVAARTYGDPAQWRAIALRNAVDDPRALEAGVRLLVPQLPYQDAETGEVFQ